MGNLPVSSLSSYAPVVLRAGLVILFLWFGLSQVSAPGDWVSWVPEWTSAFGVSASTIVLLNGAFEVVLGALLAVGFYTRVAALLLSIHLLFIAYEVGYNDVGVRDFVLAIATLSLALFEPDQYTIDKRTHRE